MSNRPAAEAEGQADENELRRWAEEKCPRLRGTAYVITSKPTEDYNCIAHAAEKSDQPWWPDRPFYWPPAVLRAETLPAFVAAFESLGYYRRTDSAALEPGIEKVAIFTRNKKPKHAARQLPDGLWSSKMGDGLDLSHDLRAIEGKTYGQVACILARPVSRPAGEASGAG